MEQEMILEVCCDNLDSAVNAAASGADRIELCQALEVGGLTPTVGLIKCTKRMVKIPVYAMIRPRAGDFTYNELDLEQMQLDIQMCLSAGVDGFVFGAIHENKVHEDACRFLMNESYGLPVTFSRAFDLLPNPEEAIVELYSLGFSRVLTSGQAPTAYEGVVPIYHLVEKYDSMVTIIAGCGINTSNLLEIIQVTGAKEYHSSCQDVDVEKKEENVVKGSANYILASRKVVAEMKRILCLESQ